MSCKYKTVIALLLLFLMVECKKSDDRMKELIIGEWESCEVNPVSTEECSVWSFTEDGYYYRYCTQNEKAVPCYNQEIFPSPPYDERYEIVDGIIEIHSIDSFSTNPSTIYYRIDRINSKKLKMTTMATNDPSIETPLSGTLYKK